MPTQLLQGLIDKQDTTEIIGDLIAQILANEIFNQMTLAQAAGKNPDDWAVRVFREVADPWQMFTDPEEAPVCSVRLVRNDAIPGETTLTEQVGTVQFFLDFGAAGRAQETEEGHTPGDLDAAIRIQAAMRLIRNIICAGPNQYLQARGLVGWRRVTALECFQPPQLVTSRPGLDFLAASRITLEAKIRETSPEFTAEDLAEISVTLKKRSDGAILSEQEYEYTEEG